jgi:FkbM family methyltransferase
MANKYLKKLGLTIGRWAANSLSQDIAIDILAQLSRRLGISSVVASGNAGRFEGHPGDLVFQYYVRQKATYPELQRLIERCLGKGPGVYIDIGANIGLTLVPIARLEDVACYGFEPEPENFALLEANIRANVPDARVKLFNVALATEKAPLEFELNEDNRGDHRVRGATLIKTEKFGESGRMTITVEGAPLDRDHRCQKPGRGMRHQDRHPRQRGQRLSRRTKGFRARRRRDRRVLPLPALAHGNAGRGILILYAALSLWRHHARHRHRPGRALTDRRRYRRLRKPRAARRFRRKVPRPNPGPSKDPLNAAETNII